MSASPGTSNTNRFDAFTGAGTLIRFMLRRDRIRIPAWLIAISLTVILTAGSFPELYQDEAERQGRAEVVNNPAVVAMVGSNQGLDDYTFGAMLTNELLVFMAIIVALMSIFLITRHTRTEEETGRTELVRSGVVGRHANLTAALAVVVGANVLLGAIIALGLGALGVESITWAGSVAYGASLAAVGLVFAGVAALAVQLSEYGRGAIGIALAVLGLAYGLRAAGDVGENFLRWLSPIGWSQTMSPYIDERWWPLLLSVGATAGLVVVAMQLSTQRDVGAGVLPPRPGPPEASESLVRPVGLAFRLQRGGLIGWSIGLLLFGLLYGTVLGEVEGFVEDNEAMRDIIAAEGMDLTDAFLGMIVALIALVSSAYAIQATLRLRSEETAGRAEPILATPVSRAQWAASHMTVAAVGSVVVLLLATLGLGVSAAITLSDAGVFLELLGAALTYVPVVWLTLGVAIALFGFIPRLAALAWVIPAYAVVVIILGGLLQFPSWLSNLSPFEHIPDLPGEAFSVWPVLVIGLIAVGLVVVGLATFERRDIHTV